MLLDICVGFDGVSLSAGAAVAAEQPAAVPTTQLFGAGTGSASGATFAAVAKAQGDNEGFSNPPVVFGETRQEPKEKQ